MDWNDDEVFTINVMREIGGWADQATVARHGGNADLLDHLVGKGALEIRACMDGIYERYQIEEYRLVSDLQERIHSAMMFLENAMDGSFVCAKATGLSQMEAVRCAHHLLQGPGSVEYEWAAKERARVEAELAIEDAAWRPKE